MRHPEDATHTVAYGTDACRARTRHFVPGYLHSVPSGTAYHLSPITHSTRSMLACIELAEMLRAGLSLFTYHFSPIRRAQCLLRAGLSLFTSPQRHWVFRSIYDRRCAL
jgi:hypothetical protein